MHRKAVRWYSHGQVSDGHNIAMKLDRETKLDSYESKTFTCVFFTVQCELSFLFSFMDWADNYGLSMSRLKKIFKALPSSLPSALLNVTRNLFWSIFNHSHFHFSFRFIIFLTRGGDNLNSSLRPVPLVLPDLTFVFCAIFSFFSRYQQYHQAFTYLFIFGKWWRRSAITLVKGIRKIASILVFT